MQLWIFNYNSKYDIYNFYYFFIKKKEKIVYIKVLLNVITIYFRKIVRFNYKNNHGHNKLDNFGLNIISKINYKILIIISYTLLGFKLRKIQTI